MTPAMVAGSIPLPVKDKLEQLKSVLRACGRTLVAYSGGVDSVLLAKVAHDVLGRDMQAVLADSPSLPRSELAGALAVARSCGFAVRVIQTQELADARYAANSPERCYFCRSILFGYLAAIAQSEGWQTIACGENASDMDDLRPGRRAAIEFRVRAPLKEVGLTKTEIRALSAQLGLPTADKPAMACLSTRIPYGEPITAGALAMIEAAEAALRAAGFRHVRVRHHRLLARVEVGIDELPRLLDDELRQRVVSELKKVGYIYVTLDLQGYRRGSANEALLAPAHAKGEQS